MNRMLSFIWIITSLVLSMILQFSTQVSAQEYFDNHIDWQHYCMRASRITMTQTEYIELLKSEHLFQAITDKSHLTIKSGKVNESFQEWREYKGKLYLDITQLNDFDFSQDNLTTTIIFYMDQQDRSQNYLDVQLTIVKDKEVSEVEQGTNPPHVFPPSQDIGGEETIREVSGNTSIVEGDIDTNNQVEKEDSAHLHENENLSFLQWLFSGKRIPIQLPFLGIILYFTPLAASQFLLAFLLVFFILLLMLGNIRMLVKYKKDKERYLCTKYKQ